MSDERPAEECSYRLYSGRVDVPGSDLLGRADVQDPRQRLQALLSQWLRMENLVVLLGAGCSRAQGGKLLGELETSVISYLKEAYPDAGGGEEGPKEQAGPNRIISARGHVVSGTGAPGFEEWLSIVANTAHLLEGAGSPVDAIKWKDVGRVKGSDLRKVLEGCRQSIMGYCGLRLPAFIPEPTGHHAFFGKLMARDPTLGRINIFTVNYDTLIEQALDDLGVQYFDGFSGKVRPGFDPSVYGIDVYYPGEVAAGRVRRFDKFALLYKLHGSVSWRVDETENEIVQVQPNLSKLERWRTSTEAIVERHKQLQTIDEDAGLPMGILPTSNKFVQTLELPYAHLFRAFGARLAQPQTFLIVIGYGFSDKHVNQMIDDAMTNPELVLLVVDPKPGDAVREAVVRYQSIGERAFLLDGADFDFFAKELMPHVRWLDDFAKLRRFEKAVAEASGADPAKPGEGVE